jgi:hypothetical protein
MHECMHAVDSPTDPLNHNTQVAHIVTPACPLPLSLLLLRVHTLLQPSSAPQHNPKLLHVCNSTQLTGQKANARGALRMHAKLHSTY